MPGWVGAHAPVVVGVGVGREGGQGELQPNGEGGDMGFVEGAELSEVRVGIGRRVQSHPGVGEERKEGVLLSGREETEINEYFIETAFPSREEVASVLTVLEAEPEGLSVPQLMNRLNNKRGRIDKA